MATLTRPQAELLTWIVEQAGGAVLFESMLSEGDAVMPARPAPEARGREYPMNAIDLRELEAQGFLRRGSGKAYEVTNEGRMAYEGLKGPPPERPPVGFSPD